VRVIEYSFNNKIKMKKLIFQFSASFLLLLQYSCDQKPREEKTDNIVAIDSVDLPVQSSKDKRFKNESNLASFQNNEKHDITYNEICALHYKWLKDPCSANMLKVDLDGLHFCRQDLLDIVQGDFCGFQMVIYCEEEAPKTLGIAYRGVNFYDEGYTDSDEFRVASRPFVTGYSRTNILHTLLKIEDGLSKISFGQMPDASETIMGRDLRPMAHNFTQINCSDYDSNRSINMDSTSVYDIGELGDFLHLSTLDNGVVCFFGYDESSTTNWVRPCLANLRSSSISGNPNSVLSWTSDRNQYFLERTFP